MLSITEKRNDIFLIFSILKLNMLKPSYLFTRDKMFFYCIYHWLNKLWGTVDLSFQQCILLSTQLGDSTGKEIFNCSTSSFITVYTKLKGSVKCVQMSMISGVSPSQSDIGLRHGQGHCGQYLRDGLRRHTGKASIRHHEKIPFSLI